MHDARLRGILLRPKYSDCSLVCWGIVLQAAPVRVHAGDERVQMIRKDKTTRTIAVLSRDS